jgi:hypothetical protein
MANQVNCQVERSRNIYAKLVGSSIDPSTMLRVTEAGENDA